MLVSAALLMTAFGAVYIVGREQNKRKVLVFKAAATFAADMLAVHHALKVGTLISGCFAVGIFLYACADMLLEVKFMAGVAYFGAGHMMLLVGMLVCVMPGWVTVAVLAVEYGTAFFTFRPYLKQLKKLRVPALMYVGFLCGMSGMAFTAAFVKNAFADWMRAAGSICFLISDGMIGWSFVHSKRSDFSGTALMILYYLAVFLLAAAFYFY